MQLYFLKEAQSQVINSLLKSLPTQIIGKMKGTSNQFSTFKIGFEKYTPSSEKSAKMSRKYGGVVQWPEFRHIFADIMEISEYISKPKLLGQTSPWTLKREL